MGFDSIDAALPTKWDHFHLYGMLGASYSRRIARNFEYSLEVSAGASEAIFPSVVDTGAVGSPYLLLGAGGRLGLDPSYNFSIELQPSARYLLSLGPLKSFDGVLFSVGITASYRLGEDPDSARAIIRALRLDSLSFGPAFAAMQSYYADNPIGRVTITNTEKVPLSGVQLSFVQPGYMDGETPGASVASLKPGESIELPLSAVFNGQVFTTEGRTPLTGQIVAKYRIGGRDVEQREPVSYVLYDKTAITWDDDRKVGAFITPQDSSLKAWTAAVSEASREAGLPGLNQPLQVALQVYQALSALGIQYQEDPSSPFTRVQGTIQSVDSISLPRTTLRQRYGDCDDLTVLFASLLETRSLRTGFITVPGHIYPAFDTGIPAASFGEISPDRGMTIALQGTLWIPVEVTLLDGRSDFLSAWQRGIELWNQYPKERALTPTAAAQVVFAPVGLQEALIQPVAPARGASQGRDRIARQDRGRGRPAPAGRCAESEGEAGVQQAGPCVRPFRPLCPGHRGIHRGDEGGSPLCHGAGQPWQRVFLPEGVSQVSGDLCVGSRDPEVPGGGHEGWSRGSPSHQPLAGLQRRGGLRRRAGLPCPRAGRGSAARGRDFRSGRGRGGERASRERGRARHPR